MRLALGVTAGVLTLGLWVWVRTGWLGYSASRFHGDGRIVAGSFWSYPRYMVSFDEISVGQTHTDSWKFGGVPTTAMTFGLRSNDPSMEKRDQAGAVLVEATLSRDDGSIVSTVNAPLAEWVLTSAPGVPKFMFWHPSMRGIVMRSDATYVLTIQLTAPDGANTDLLVTPVLEGGGNELP